MAVQLSDFDHDVVPTLESYATIPCLSPAFDATWATAGHLTRAMDLYAEWARSRRFRHHTVEVRHLPGRTPVLVSKLAHNVGDGWNNKRSDMRNLTDYCSREIFKGMPLAWQIFDVRQTAAEDADSVPPEHADQADAHRMEGAFYLWRAAEFDALLGADAILYGQGTIGLYVEKMLGEMGLADVVKAFKAQFQSGAALARAADPTATTAGELGEAQSNKTLETE